MEYLAGLIRLGVDEKTARIFMRYHARNPWLWPEIEARALAQIKNGETRVGVKGICEDIRKECHRPGEPFAVNNSYTSCYSRIFVLKYPHFKDLIELRVTKGLSLEEETLKPAAAPQQQLLNIPRRFEYA